MGLIKALHGPDRTPRPSVPVKICDPPRYEKPVRRPTYKERREELIGRLIDEAADTRRNIVEAVLGGGSGVQTDAGGNPISAPSPSAAQSDTPDYQGRFAHN